MSKYTDEEIERIEALVRELLGMNEELNAKIITMDAYVKNGDAKIRLLQKYVQSLELTIKTLEYEARVNH